jgi:arylsulfatase A-like enzyme
MFILRAPGVEPGQREGMHLLDVAPTVLELLGQPVPPAMRGTSMLERVTA